MVATPPENFKVSIIQSFGTVHYLTKKNKVMFLKTFSIQLRQGLKKSLLIMKLTAIIMLALCLQANARGYAQQVTLTLRDVPLQKVFKEIQTQTGYHFLYPYELLESAGNVTVKVKNASIEEALIRCLDKTHLTFTIVERTVVIKEKEKEATILEVPFLIQPEPAFLKVSGKVSDEEGNPLPGVSVLIKGSTQGTNTNESGQFSIEVPEGSTRVLVFSFVGRETLEVPLNNRTEINVVLRRNVEQQSEIVVVGYSTRDKSELTSAVSVISGNDLRDVTSSNIGAMLQGKVAGLQVVNSSGVPGAVPELRLRGVSSVNASQSPLFVVDGIIGGNYDPSDVESVTVLKDAGATAMYGSQANAGVVIVTTKKGKSGKTRYNLKTSAGFRTPDFGKMDMMNGEELYYYQKQFYRDYVPADSGNSFKVDVLKFYN